MLSFLIKYILTHMKINQFNSNIFTWSIHGKSRRIHYIFLGGDPFQVRCTRAQSRDANSKNHFENINFRIESLSKTLCKTRFAEHTVEIRDIRKTYGYLSDFAVISNRRVLIIIIQHVPDTCIALVYSHLENICDC